MDEQDKNLNPQEEKSAENELEKVKRERDEYLAGWQRAKADFINYKKDELSRMERVAKYGEEELMRELVVILDSFDLGINAMERKGEVEKGIYMIRSQMEDVLKRYGLSKIPVKPGDAFDPAIHEAIVEVESDSPPGSVLEEIEPGYRLHEKLIRPSRVKVAKHKE
jgi:molecular chaperone GrpE